MEDCLVRYFAENKECPLPGIGSIILKETQAHVDFGGRNIESPKSTLHFSNNEISDISLLSLIQKEYQCDNNLAKEKLALFIQSVTALPIRSSMSIGALGTLRKNDINEIELEQFPNLSIYQEDISAQKLVKQNAPHAILVGDKETTREAMQEYYEEDTPVWKSKWWIASIIILAISTGLILLHYFYFHGNSRFGNHLGF